MQFIIQKFGVEILLFSKDALKSDSEDSTTLQKSRDICFLLLFICCIPFQNMSFC